MEDPLTFQDLMRACELATSRNIVCFKYQLNNQYFPKDRRQHAIDLVEGR